MPLKLISFVLALLFGTQVALAQSDDAVWVQIKARPSLAEATAEAQNFAQTLPNVNGFSLGGGWYAIALGPYTRPEADQALRQLRRSNAIPRDAYITFSSAFEDKFWPVDASAVTTTSPLEETTTEEAPSLLTSLEATNTAEPAVTLAIPPEPEFKDAGETENEALASERRLSREQKKDLQRLLQWAGHYNSAIDGAFGRGTRRAMSAWQAANGYEPIGVMSTLQRAEILTAYNAILDGMDMRLVSDFGAGIEIDLPMGVLRKTPAIYPFSTFEAKSNLDAQVILISQEGNRTSLAGLYEILQTLTIMPLNGPRKLNKSGFTILGEDAKTVSYAEVGLRDGEIKGFVLVWPAEDEARRRRILSEMQKSFRRIPGVLSPDTGAELLDDIDLLAGLEIRRPKYSRSGFFTDASGTVVTTTAAVQECQRVTLNEEVEAEVINQEPGLGLAVLRPKQNIAPMSTATFRDTQPRRTSEVAVAGYSFEGILGAPTLTYGTIQDTKGLGGEADLNRLALAPQPGDAGGPVFDIGGNVVGMLLARAETGGRQLPNDVSLTANADAIRTLLAASGLAVSSADQSGALDPVDLTEYAGEMTVLVSCW